MNPPADSSVNSVTVPIQGGDPATLYRAVNRPLRVVVRNSGGALILISYDASALQNIGSFAGTFRLPQGASETFVLMPKQSLLAAATGAGGIASIAVSEALPQVWIEA